MKHWRVGQNGIGVNGRSITGVKIEDVVVVRIGIGVVEKVDVVANVAVGRDGAGFQSVKTHGSDELRITD